MPWTASAKTIAFSPEQMARVFEAAATAGLRVKLHADQLSNLHGAALAARFNALSADHLEHCRRSRHRGDDQGRDVLPCCCRARSISCAIPNCRQSKRCAGWACRIALATDCNPGTSPLTSMLLAMNMGATLFRLTVGECLAGVTREAARALGKLERDRHARSRQTLRSGHLGYRTAGRSGLSHGLQSAPCAREERTMMQSPPWLEVIEGTAPLLVSIPHTGTEISDDIEDATTRRLAGAARRRLGRGPAL